MESKISSLAGQNGLTEAQIQHACLQVLEWHPLVAWAERMNVGAAYLKGGRYVRFAFPGCADIIGQLRTGHFLAVEVKRPCLPPDEQQARFLERVTANGGVAIVAHSAEQLAEVLNAWAPL